MYRGPFKVPQLPGSSVTGWTGLLDGSRRIERIGVLLSAIRLLHGQNFRTDFLFFAFRFFAMFQFSFFEFRFFKKSVFFALDRAARHRTHGAWRIQRGYVWRYRIPQLYPPPRGRSFPHLPGVRRNGNGRNQLRLALGVPPRAQSSIVPPQCVIHFPTVQCSPSERASPGGIGIDLINQVSAAHQRAAPHFLSVARSNASSSGIGCR
jgi:hypothetical protein